jgi:hypothetical protein
VGIASRILKKQPPAGEISLPSRYTGAFGVSKLVVGENSLTLLDHRGHACPTKSLILRGPRIESRTAKVNSACEILRFATNLTRLLARLAVARGSHGRKDLCAVLETQLLVKTA